MIEIWGRRNSSNVIPVLWAVAETGEDYRRHDAGGSFGGLKTPDYRAMNPNGLVPTLVDDGFVLWESNAIIRYLAAKYCGDNLWDADPARRALADRWMEWAKSTGIPPTMGLFFATVRTEPEARNPAAIAKRGDWDQAGVPTVEHYMNLKSWFAGSTEDLIEYLKDLEERFPGLEYINLSTPVGTPQTKMLELFQQVGEDVMPHFGGGKQQAAAE